MNTAAVQLALRNRPTRAPQATNTASATGGHAYGGGIDSGWPGTAKTADGLVAGVFLAAWQQRVRHDPDRAPARAWLYGIATSLGRQHTRSEVGRLRSTATHGVQVTASKVTGDWLLRTHQGEGDPQPAEEIRGAYPGPSTGGSDGLWSSPTPWFYAGLPRDPRALYGELTSPTAGPAVAEVPHRIRWITLLPPPADRRAVLVRALAFHDPPATVRDGVRTRDGRRAVAVGLPYPGTDLVLELLFDPGDCQVLGSQTATPGGPFSGVTIRLAVVGAIGELP